MYQMYCCSKAKTKMLVTRNDEYYHRWWVKKEGDKLHYLWSVAKEKYI